MLRIALLLSIMGILLPARSFAQAPASGKNTMILRGQAQTIYFYPHAAAFPQAKGKVLYLPGDFGMFGLGITIAKTMASWGYDVYGLDTKRYLESFTGKTPLRETDVMTDFLQIANWIALETNGAQAGDKADPIALVGWSEGAGLCLLAAVPEANQKRFAGLITLGMTETNSLAWHWSDLLPSLARFQAKAPRFQSAEYLPKVSPLPLQMIQSSRDQYVSVEAARKLFAAAQEPKRFQLIQARNHRFEGNQEALYEAIREGLEWALQNSP